VHRAAGPRLLAACREIGGCPTGTAVVTPAFDLEPRVRWVVHAVGPVWSGAPDDADLLTGAYRDALRCADEVGARSIAFPAISTGVYGYPKDEAAAVSVAALRGATTSVEQVLLCAFDAGTARLWEQACSRTAERPDTSDVPRLTRRRVRPRNVARVQAEPQPKKTSDSA
jgi:O-acetyl-ADP-ribose deacetylase (regulator of RNase III)